MSIRLRLTLWYTGILAAALLVFGTALYMFLSIKMNNDAKDSIRQLSREVQSQISIIEYPVLNVVDINLPDLRDFKVTGVYLQSITIGGGDSLLRYDRSSNLNFNLSVSEDALTHARQGESVYVRQTIRGVPFWVYYTPIDYNGQFIGLLQVAIRLDGIAQFLDDLRWTLAALVVAAVLLAATLGWFLARKTLSPIEEVISATDRIERGEDLANRIAYAGPPDEIGRLTKKINGMLARLQETYNNLEEAYRMQRRFVSDASHELRTPLTTIRGNVELMDKMWQQLNREGRDADPEQMALFAETMKDIAGESERMSRLVNDLLSLARADAGFVMDTTEVDMYEMVQEVVRRAQFWPRSAEWQVADLAVLEGLKVQGNKDYLQQLLSIFIENAFKYTDTGVVRLAARKREGWVGVEIRDTGIGMEPDEVPHIFERFYRADVSRGKTSGTGLGLAIAKWILDEHGGSIEVSTAKGEGTTFTLWFPIVHESDYPSSLR